MVHLYCRLISNFSGLLKYLKRNKVGVGGCLSFTAAVGKIWHFTMKISVLWVKPEVFD